MVETPYMQSVMDQAYEGFTRDMTYPQFIGSLDEKTRQVVVCGNLNYQVHNGGFGQWMGNGYTKVEVLAILKSLDIKVPEHTKVIAMVDDVLNLEAHAQNLDDMYDWEEEEEEEDAIYQELDTYDVAFYALADSWLESLEEYFKTA